MIMGKGREAVKGAELIVDCLESEGVEYVFGLPGEENIALIKEIENSRINFILNRHEQGSAFMANVYGRLTHEPGVCLTTLGPGATNLVTGIADAYLDKAPVLAITAQAGIKKLHKAAHQYIELTGIFSPITAWSRRIESADTIPEIFRKAFDIAKDFSKPAHIEVPENIAEEQTKAKPLKRFAHFAEIPSNKAIEKAAEKINSASSALILAGNGIIRSEAWKELRSFAEQSNIFVVTTLMGKGAMNEKSELFLGTLTAQESLVLNAIEKAELIIAIGYDYVELPPEIWNKNKNKKIIHIHNSHAEIDEHYFPAISLIGEIPDILRVLATIVKRKKISKEFLKIKAEVESYADKHAKSNAFPIKPQTLVSKLNTLAENSIIVSDVGAHKFWIGKLYRAMEPNSLIISNGFSSMGFAVPGAIAAKLILNEKNVIAACGDGGFMMSLQEIETATRHNLPVKIIIFNDSRYGLIEAQEIKKFGKSFGVEFRNPDFVKLAHAFNIEGARVNNAYELESLLKEMLESKNSFILDVPIDYRENLKIFNEKV